MFQLSFWKFQRKLKSRLWFTTGNICGVTTVGLHPDGNSDFYIFVGTGLGPQSTFGGFSLEPISDPMPITAL